MSPVKSIEDLKRIKENALEKRRAQTASGQVRITTSMGTCSIAVGAQETMKAIRDVIDDEGLSDVIVTQTGCVGLCEWEPIVEVSVGQEPKVTYVKVSPEKAKAIMREHVMGSKIIPEYVIPA